MSDKKNSKSSNKNLSLLTIASYSSGVFEKTQLNCRKVAKQMIYSPTPEWELMKADFDKEHTEMKKEDNPHILSYIVISHFPDTCSNRLKMYTDGSVLKNEAGAGFVIPEFKTEKYCCTVVAISIL